MSLPRILKTNWVVTENKPFKEITAFIHETEDIEAPNYAKLQTLARITTILGTPAIVTQNAILSPYEDLKLERIIGHTLFPKRKVFLKSGKDPKILSKLERTVLHQLSQRAGLDKTESNKIFGGTPKVQKYLTIYEGNRIGTRSGAFDSISLIEIVGFWSNTPHILLVLKHIDFSSSELLNFGRLLTLSGG